MQRHEERGMGLEIKSELWENDVLLWYSECCSDPPPPPPPLLFPWVGGKEGGYGNGTCGTSTYFFLLLLF